MGESKVTKTNSNNVGYSNKNNDHYYNHHKKPSTSKNKKNMFKGSLMNVMKVVLYMLRRKGDKTGKKLSPSLSTATNTSLTNFVGAFRPFHLQRDIGGMTSSPYSQLLFSRHDEVTEVRVSSSNDKFEASPYHSKYDASSSSSSSSSRSSSSRGDMSKYASAQSLNDLDNVEEDEEDSDEEEGMMIDGDAYYDGLEGDEMIDAKADKFIAKFYQQMRLQNF